MHFHDPKRFAKYCVAKRRTYLRQLTGRPNPARFFDLWRGEFELSGTRFQIGGVPETARPMIARELRWILLADLYALARRAVPDLPPAPQTVLEGLTGGLHQVRHSRSMLITGEEGSGKEQLACLLHVLSGRPGTLVRIPARDLGRAGQAHTKQLLPERGSVFLRDLENMGAAAQEDLLTFLNGEARRRDLLFFASTKARSWDLASIHGIRRELLTRVSQTEIRLPSITTRADDRQILVEDVLFDAIQIESNRMGALREEAHRLATEWQSDQGIPAPQDYDFISEALSYVLWREKSKVANTALPRIDWEEFEKLSSFREIAAHAVRAIEPIQGSEEGFSAPKGRQTARPLEQGDPPMPTDRTRDELLFEYYQALLREENGDWDAVALRANGKKSDLTKEFLCLEEAFAKQRKKSANPKETPLTATLSHQAKPGG